MDFQEYKEICKKMREGETCKLTVEEMFSFIMQDKASNKELSDVMYRLLELQRKLNDLHNFTHGHIEGHPMFRDTETQGKCCVYDDLSTGSILYRHDTPDRVITRHEVDGKTVVFENMGEL